MILENYRSGLDRGARLWKEAAWRLLKVPFFLLPVPLPSALRAAILRGFGAKAGRGLVIRHGVDVSFPWRLRLGDHVWLGEGVKILSLARVEIGSNVCISQEAFLCTGSHDFQDPHFALRVAPIRIGDRCWVGARVFVGPGVTFHSDSMAAACAVVVKDVESGCVVGGNPARTLRKLAG